MVTKIQIISIATGIVLIILSLIFFRETKLLWFLIGLAAVIAIMPFLISVITETGREKEKEEMFLEFARDLVESVKAGSPISKSIVHVSAKNYGSLTPHVKKLANQILLAIPLKQALRTFASEVQNKVVSRSIELIIEAETSGGEIGNILTSVVKNATEIEDLKKERASRVYSMIVQGYIIFFIFVTIMLFVELKFMPMITSALGGTAVGLETGTVVGGVDVSFGQQASQELIERSFFILLLMQALFAGLVIGKLSEGSIRYGIKHSGILLTITYLIVTATRALVA
ncbi:MAG: type II secretion system F family protein [Candidatus Pacearchaeota archaeon]|nr:type II secretion system F family protein [Candidatus Pacearchaeota archaeon]